MAAELPCDPLTPQAELGPSTGVSGGPICLCGHLPVTGGDSPHGQREEMPEAQLTGRLTSSCPQRHQPQSGVRYEVS